MPAGRIAGEIDAVGVDVELPGMCVQPADRTHQVLVSGRRRRASGEPIVDGHREVAGLRPILDVELHATDAFAAGPSTAVNVEDRRYALAGLGVGDVGEHRGAIRATVDDVALNDDVLGHDRHP